MKARSLDALHHPSNVMMASMALHAWTEFTVEFHLMDTSQPQSPAIIWELDIHKTHINTSSSIHSPAPAQLAIIVRGHCQQ